MTLCSDCKDMIAVFRDKNENALICESCMKQRLDDYIKAMKVDIQKENFEDTR